MVACANILMNRDAGEVFMFTHRHYVPILKWKQGEYQALLRLTPTIKNRITPLIEIPPIGYDYENEKPSATIDAHLAEFGNRLRAKWQSRNCFVDTHLVGDSKQMANGQHTLGFVLGKARENQCSAIPVVRVTSPEPFLAAAKGAIQLDGRGVCLRLTAGDFDSESLRSDIEAITKSIGAGRSETDIVIDLADFGYPSKLSFKTSVMAMLDMVPSLNQWRTLTVAGASFPASVSQAVEQGVPKELPRKEWTSYTYLRKELSDSARIPTFGDYGVAHSDVLSLDMRIVKPLAKLRYTVDNAWYVALGSNVRSNGFGQFKEMCKKLVGEPYFRGPGYSVGDAYIHDCAFGSEPSGNLTTWVWVSTNCHLTKVVADLASLDAP